MTTPIHFVSLGPGDPELATLRVWRILKEVDIVYCPATAMDTKLLSRSKDIMMALGIAEDKLRTFTLPMSADRNKAKAVYDETAEIVMQKAQRGMKIAVAAEGDISIYASIHYMMDKIMAAGFHVLQHCGVPSFIAATEHGCVPLTLLEERLTVIPGNASAEELEYFLENGHNVVIMKLSRCADTVKEFMCTHPQYTYRYAENVSVEGKAVYYSDIARLQEIEFPYFSMITISQKRYN